MPTSENIQTTVGYLNRNFAGRRDAPDYDPTKRIHIHNRNRAFVWTREDQIRCLDSILRGFYIPPIISSSVIVDGVEQRHVMEGGNRITTFRNILNGELGPLSPEQRILVESFPITLVVMSGLTPVDQNKMFRRLNKSKKVSDGQLFDMYSDDSPLVAAALSLLEQDTHPLRQKITDLFYDTRGADSAGKTNLSNAVALVSGATNGVQYITKSFNVQEEMVESKDPIDVDKVAKILEAAFNCFEMANGVVPLTDGRKRRGQFSVGGVMGVILYDLHTNPGGWRLIQDKWATFITRLRRGDPNATLLMEARIWSGNLNPTRHKRISTMVDIYLRERRVASSEEIEQVRHIGDDDEDDEESWSEPAPNV